MDLVGPVGPGRPPALQAVDEIDRREVAEDFGVNYIRFVANELQWAAIQDLKSGGNPPVYLVGEAVHRQERAKALRTGLSRKALKWNRD